MPPHIFKIHLDFNFLLLGQLLQTASTLHWYCKWKWSHRIADENYRWTGIIYFKYANQLYICIKSLRKVNLVNYRKSTFLVKSCHINPNNYFQLQELRKKWHKENVRRRHNYLPFIVELLKQLASNEQLIPVFEKAKAKSIELDKKKKEKKTGEKWWNTFIC